MPRTFLPALRSARHQPTFPVEVKSYPYATLSSGGFRTAGWVSLGGENRASGWDLDAVTTEAFERCVWAFRCIELFSSSQSRLPFRVARHFGTDRQELIEDHPLYRVLNRQANPLETGRQFRKRLSAQTFLSKKGAFVEVTKSALGVITRLDLLHPARVEIVPSDHGDYIDHFAYTRRTGELVELDPERVRWVREPHPIDPFCGTTPLEAAGMSIEMDQQARVFNVSFIKNDSRPGGVLSIHAEGIPDQELQRIKEKFAPGAHVAGDLAVVGSGPGGLDYVDTSARPRDMAYNEMSTTAKHEILAAFGIGESVLGSAEGRTFDNAEQEEYNFWTKPMPPHNDLIAGAFAQDIDPELTPFIDTSTVDALELAVRRRRTEAREEFNAGLRSIDEYRPLSDLEPLATPQTRALWISPQKAPIPGIPADAAALLGGQDVGGGPTPPPAEPGRTAAQAVDEARDEADLDLSTPPGPAAAAVSAAREDAEDVPEEGPAAAAVAEARDTRPVPRGARSTARGAVAEARMEGKALPAGEGGEFSTEGDDVTRVEVALSAALTALMARQKGIITARLESPKTRKGTRFWRADGSTDSRGGDDVIDMVKAVNAEQWHDETLETAAPIVQGAAVDTSTGMLTVFGEAGVLAGAAAEAVTAGKAALSRTALGVAAPAALLALVTLGDAVTDWLGDLTRALDDAQRRPDAQVKDLTAVVEEHYTERAPQFARDIGGDVATMVVNGAAEATARSLAAVGEEAATIVREWVSRRDARVRPTHREVDGTTLPVGEPFTVGGASMAFPQDPSAPPRERFGCRCRCVYRTTPGVLFDLLT